MEKMTAFERSLAWAGSVTKLARALGIHHANIALWRRRGGEVPAHHAIQIEKLTRGMIRAVDFFPDTTEKKGVSNTPKEG